MADLSMIVRMVIYKCRELNNPVTETLAAYVAQTTMKKATEASVIIQGVELLAVFRHRPEGPDRAKAFLAEQRASHLTLPRPSAPARPPAPACRTDLTSRPAHRASDRGCSS